jgi:hypothetical protein
LILCALFGRRGAERCMEQTAPRPWARGGLSDRLAGLFLKGALWRRLHGWKISKSGSEQIKRITGKAIVRFGALWHRLARPMLGARVQGTLHAGAAVLAACVVAGMALRAVLLRFPAAWYGDWLDARQVGWLLRAILGPAAALLGRPLPDLAPLKAPGPGGPAAPWVELYALTVVLYVVLPRTVLAILEARRSMRLAAQVPIDLRDSYFRKIFTAWRGATRRVQVVPYGFRPKLNAVAALKNLLYDSFGARAEIQMSDPLPQGAEETAFPPEPQGAETEPGPPDSATRESYLVMLFSLTQPHAPEHRSYLERMKTRVESAQARMVVLIDVSGYRQRASSTEQWMERLRAWKDALDGIGLTAVELDLDRPAVDRAMAAVREGLWPAPQVVENEALP